MPKFTLEDKLVVAISSRALFDFEEENRIFETGDLARYEALQRSRLETPAKPGVAFGLIRKLLALNAAEQRIEVVILSRAIRSAACARFISAASTDSRSSAACSRAGVRRSRI